MCGISLQLSNEKSSAGDTAHGPTPEAPWSSTAASPPAASPGFLRQLPQPIRPADLLGAKLLYEFNREDWYKWLDAVGQPGRPPIDARQIDDSHTLRRLAADGHGIALFFVGLVQDDLRTQQLVQPFDLTVDTGDHYYLTWPQGRPMHPKLATFSHWLRDEIRKQPYA